MFPPKKTIEIKLREKFLDRETFTRNELFDFFQEYEPEIKKGTFGWRIYDLKKKQIIKDVWKGIYTLANKQSFRPEPDPIINQIGFFLQGSSDHPSYNVWTTAWLNEFIELQATSSFYIVEVEKVSMESVFYTLKDANILPSIFIKPDEKVIETYISELPEAIIVEPMITRAPVIRVQDIIFPTLEKILVDLYCEDKLFFAYQGRQLVKIYESCLEKYVINFSRLFNYARRRKREDSLKNFLYKHQNLYENIKESIE